MKMNSQTRNFAKQVQVDLLGLADADLFQTVHLWVNSAPSDAVSEETRSALGYTSVAGGPSTQLHSTLAGSESGSAIEGGIEWQAPDPQELRERLADMNVQLFVQHVLPLAFQSLHAEHPEWGEGATFNAHLANHLRCISTKR
jgi:hypothetical protein